MVPVGVEAAVATLCQRAIPFDGIVHVGRVGVVGAIIDEELNNVGVNGVGDVSGVWVGDGAVGVHGVGLRGSVGWCW